MEFWVILQTTVKLCGEAQMALNNDDRNYASDKLLELKNFLVDNFDDTPEEPTSECAADEAATEAESTAKEASQEETTEVPSES